MEIGEYGIDPRHAEDTGSHDHNDRGDQALADAAARRDGAVHEGADGVGKAHDPRALKPRFDDCLLVGEQGEELSAEEVEGTAEQRACHEGICDADEVAFQHAIPLAGAKVLPHEGGAGGVERRHDVIDHGVGVGGGGIALDHDGIEGVDGALNEEIRNGEDGVLESRGNSEPENAAAFGRIESLF